MASPKQTMRPGGPPMGRGSSDSASTLGRSKFNWFGHQRQAMADKKKNPGHQLLVLAFFLLWAASGVWWLYVISGVLFLVGIMVTAGYALKNQQSVSQQTAQGIQQFLPTSKGVAWLEFVTNQMDNPDTAIQSVDGQPEGTHPSMQGISAQEFGRAYETDEFARGVSAQEFVSGVDSGEFTSKGITQFAKHDDDSLVPKSWSDPVSEWYDPVSAWYDPFG